MNRKSGRTRRFQPNRAKLDKAISDILDKAVNADSDNAPKQLRVILLTENPQWKLPERRVARYLKRHLKARQNPLADAIEADMDEETVYTMTESMIGARSADTNSILGTTNDAYVDENESAAKKESKPLFCDGCTCVIS